MLSEQEVFSVHFFVLSAMFRLPPMCAGRRTRHKKIPKDMKPTMEPAYVDVSSSSKR
jgi:hypothetical protein